MRAEIALGGIVVLFTDGRGDADGRAAKSSHDENATKWNDAIINEGGAAARAMGEEGGAMGD